MTANEAASSSSASETPRPATTTPPIAGPAAVAAANPTFTIALPWRSIPCGSSVAATAARDRARAVRSSTPSSSASARTAGSEKRWASSARPT